MKIAKRDAKSKKKFFYNKREELQVRLEVTLFLSCDVLNIGY
jgi:hypothetical protein